jgi:hypothetical protein
MILMRLSQGPSVRCLSCLPLISSMDRCYNLGDPLQRNEFVDDFKISAVVTILVEVREPRLSFSLTRPLLSLQWVQRTDSQTQPPSEPSLPLIRNCLSVLSSYLTLLQSRSLHPHQSRKSHSSPTSPLSALSISSSDSCLLRLSDQQWNEILLWSTQLLSSSPSPFPSPLPTHSRSDLKRLSIPLVSHSPLFIQAVYQLSCFQSLSTPQAYLSGYHNIWIVKAPEASKGTNIKLFSSLSEILLYEKGMAGRIVQKYIERPLLIPLSRFTLPPLLSISSSSNRKGGPRVKFDLRIWVLVTSLNCETPPRVYLYKEIYGRRCSSSYNLTPESLSDSFRHLTNYSIQKSRVRDDQLADDPPPQTRGGEGDGEGGDASHSRSSFTEGVKLFTSKVNQLRSTVQNYRPSSASRSTSGSGRTGGPNLTSSDLLVTHHELMEYLSFIQHTTHTWRQVYHNTTTPHSPTPHSDIPDDEPTLWTHCIWPRIKHKIFALIVKTQTEATPRENSFEFLGVDVLLDDRCDPWVLEVNLTPGLSHRNQEHNQYIERMASELVEIVLRDCRNGGEEEEKKWERVTEVRWELVSEECRSNLLPGVKTSLPPLLALLGGGEPVLGVLFKEMVLLNRYFPALYQTPLPHHSAAVSRTQDIIESQNSALSISPRSALSSSYQRKISLSVSPVIEIVPPPAATQSVFTPQIDFTFTVTGIWISKPLLFYLDLCCDRFMGLLLIQRLHTGLHFIHCSSPFLDPCLLWADGSGAIESDHTSSLLEEFTALLSSSAPIDVITADLSCGLTNNNTHPSASNACGGNTAQGRLAFTSTRPRQRSHSSPSSDVIWLAS